MINKQQMAIAQKDIQAITKDKAYISILLVPFIFTIIMPVGLVIGIGLFLDPNHLGDFESMLSLFSGSLVVDNIQEFLINQLMNSAIPLFFLMTPIMIASTGAASSFVGEKEKRTLETLLYSPLSVEKIFQAKVLSSFLLSMAFTICSFVLMVPIIQLASRLTMGTFITFNLNWLVTLLIVAPTISLFSIILIVSGSAKAKTVDESFQRSAFLVLPILLIAIGQFAGVMLINLWLLLGVGIFFGILSAIFWKRVADKFTYELLLR
ncbi:MAG: ABC transporter permease subunit [Streptococcaceae bacterium]|nr:ABC transporter permease subunit [Streptococcaceae bacterium]